jgi:hypothetical protein
VWPPAIGIPAWRQIDSPPRITWPICSTVSRSIGIATRASAMIGRPPIA